MSKKPTAGFQLTGTIKRTDFGIGTKFPDQMVSDIVRISKLMASLPNLNA